MTELPRKAHPTAKAFFDALDQYNKNQDDDNSNEGDAVTDDTATSPEKPFMSESLLRKSQSLGWRNRNSQNEFYPVTVCQSLSESKSETDSRTVQIRRRNFSVRQVQRGEVEGTYGTGATVWPAAMVLIKYLERVHKNGNNRDNCDKISKSPCVDSEVSLRGRHVIDLGGGTGVASIAAALFGATSVVCTDGEESVVRLARDNILRASQELSMLPHQKRESKVPTTHLSPRIAAEEAGQNDAGTTMNINDCPIRAQRYWWGDETSRSLLSTKNDNGLAILVADCVLPKLYPIAPLVQAIDDCLRLYDDNKEDEGKCDDMKPLSAVSNSFAVLSYEHRYYPDYDPRIEFRRLALERSLEVFAVPRDEMDPVYSLEDVEIWIVRRINRL